jgi:NAD(P)-dependent dehydrogenase (short-subunit alcohol dehydrogenase family)
MFDFSGKVAMVSGAAGNLGKAVADALERAGARLVLVDLSEDRLNALYGAAERLTLPADLTDEASVAQAVAQALSRYGRIDLLANIAGGFTMGPALHETPTGTWEFMLNLNARSAFLLSRAVIPHMLRQGGGRIVNVAARAAVQPKGRMVPYCVSKAAVVTLTEGMAAEYRDRNINVNCVLPGTIDTPQNRADMPDADFGQWVLPAALADAILFLFSDAARAVSGAALPVYGRS